MRLDTLTSLRFFAAAAIVIGHAHSSFGSAGLAISFPLDQGVSFFFVLSGFILAYTYPNLREVSSVRHFWIARFARIWPAHLATLLLVTIVAPNMPPVEHRLSITLANILLLQSWLPFRDSILSYNGVAWSISTEFFFYLCFPVLIHNWQKNWYLKLLFTAALTTGVIIICNVFNLPSDSSYRGLVGGWGLVYIHPITRLFEFTVGIAACNFYKKINTAHISRNHANLMEIFALSIMLFSSWILLQVSNSVLLSSAIGKAGAEWLRSSGSVFVFAGAIVIFALQKGIVSQCLKLPFLVLLGEISFSVYLVHTIVLHWYESNTQWFSTIDLPLVYCAYWLAVLCLSYLIYKRVECPARIWILNKTINVKIYHV